MLLVPIPLLIASHPQVDHKANKRKKTTSSANRIGPVSIEHSSFSILPSQTLCGFEGTRVESLNRVPGITQHCANILFLIYVLERNKIFRKVKKKDEEVLNVYLCIS